MKLTVTLLGYLGLVLLAPFVAQHSAAFDSTHAGAFGLIGMLVVLMLLTVGWTFLMAIWGDWRRP